MPRLDSVPAQVLGVDIAKDTVTVYDSHTHTVRTIANERPAIRRMLSACGHDCLVVCEPTGGHEKALLEECVKAGLPAHRADTTRLKAFIRSFGKLAKTDAIDARLIARYGLTPGLQLYDPPSPEQAALRQLRQRRDELQQMLHMETNRTEHASTKRLKSSIQRHLGWLRTELEAIEMEIQTLIESAPELERKAKLMRSLKGVGPHTAAAILAYLPEIGSIPKATVAAIAGLAPIAQDSGQQHGNRHIAGGRANLRSSLYMAALVARHHNPTIRTFAMTLKARGKPNKVVLTAVMRKLLTTLNAIMRDQTPWQSA